MLTVEAPQRIENVETVRVYRWTRQEYERMIDAGVFHPEARVELVNGKVIEMSPQKRLRASAILLVQEALRTAFGAEFMIQPQLPLALGDASLPEPDIAVVPGTPRDYPDHPDKAMLVLEVSESSLAFDRSVKLALYARSDVPEYWIVNLVDYVVEVYRDPNGDIYGSKATYSESDRLAPLAFPEALINVADLLP